MEFADRSEHLFSVDNNCPRERSLAERGAGRASPAPPLLVAPRSFVTITGRNIVAGEVRAMLRLPPAPAAPGTLYSLSAAALSHYCNKELC